MRHYVIASHGGFSKGIYESININAPKESPKIWEKLWFDL